MSYLDEVKATQDAYRQRLLQAGEIGTLIGYAGPTHTLQSWIEGAWRTVYQTDDLGQMSKNWLQLLQLHPAESHRHLYGAEGEIVNQYTARSPSRREIGSDPIELAEELACAYMRARVECVEERWRITMKLNQFVKDLIVEVGKFEDFMRKKYPEVTEIDEADWIEQFLMYMEFREEDQRT
jgi:hypothetical protein